MTFLKESLLWEEAESQRGYTKMEETSWLMSAAVVAGCAAVLTPYILLGYLKVKLRKVGFRARVGGLMRLTGIRFRVGDGQVPVLISSVQLSYHHRKVLITVSGIELDLTSPSTPRSPRPPSVLQVQGGLFALLIRILLLFIAQYVEVCVIYVAIYMRGVGVCGEEFRLSLQIDHTVILTQNAESKISLYAAPFRILIGRSSEVRIGPLTVDLLLPTSVSLAQSLKKSLCRLALKEISGEVTTEDLFHMQLSSESEASPKDKQDCEQAKLPKRTSLDIGQCRVQVNNSEFIASSFYCLVCSKELLKIRVEAKGLELKRFSETLVCVPALDVETSYETEKWEMTYVVDFVYMAVGRSLAEFLSNCIPVTTPTLAKVDNPPTAFQPCFWTQSFTFSTIKLSLFDDTGTKELLKGEVLGLRLNLSKGSNLDVTIACTVAEVKDETGEIEVLSVSQPDVMIQIRHVDFSCASARAHWVKAVHEACYPSILTVMRCFTSRHRKKWKSNSPAKDVNLDFANVSVTFSFAPDESLRAEVSRFQTDILRSEKLLKLCFTNSHLFAQEIIEKEIISCEDLAVNKRYIEKDGEIAAKIDVTATGTDVFVPDSYPWGRAIFKSVINVVTGIRWTISFLFPGVPRVPHIVFMEKAVTSLTLARVRVVIEDGILHAMVRRKLIVKADSDVYPQLRALQKINPMLVLSFQMTTGEFGTIYPDNTKLSTPASALSALQDMDYFEIPPESYFAFIMANDLKMSFSNCSCYLRDFPWKLYQIDLLTLKGRSMVNKNRLPLHNWARWKIHSSISIGLSGVTFTLGLCLRSTLFDILDTVKRMIIRRGDPPQVIDKTPRLAFIDRIRYVFNGSTRTKIRSLTVNFLDSEYPLRPTTISLYIDRIVASQMPQKIESSISGLVVQGIGRRPLCVIPKMTNSMKVLFICDDPNPWVTDLDFESHDAFKSFRFYDTELEVQTEFLVQNEDTLELTYDSVVSAQLFKLLLFHIKPPAILMQKSKRKKHNILEKIRLIRVENVAIYSPRILLLTADGTGLQITIDKISGVTTLNRDDSPRIFPITVTDTSAVCSNIHLCAFDGEHLSGINPKEFENYQMSTNDFLFGAEQTMMTCLTIELRQDEGSAEGKLYEKHLTIAGLRLLWTKRLESMMWQLLTIDPTQILVKLVKKNRQTHTEPSTTVENESGIIDAPNFDSEEQIEERHKYVKTRIEFYMEILSPQFNLQNDNTMAQMLMIASVARCEILTHTLVWDKPGLDMKTEIIVEVESLETFVAPGMVDIRRPVCWLETAQQLTPSLSDSETFEGILRCVFTSRTMTCRVTHFRLPFNYYDFATNRPQANKFKWLDEMRINDVKIALPEMQARMESEHLWTLIDVIQGVLFQIEGSRKAETVSELLKYEEIRKFGREDIRKHLCDRLDKEQWFKVPRVLKAISISIDFLAFRMTKNHEVMLSVDIFKVNMEVKISHLASSTKSFSVHKISVIRDKCPVLQPLMLENEEFHDSNMMITLRSSERLAFGKSQASWHVFEHLELYLYPLSLEITHALYKDIYAFIFPSQEEMDDEQKEAILTSASGGPRRIQSRKDLLKPLSRRKRLPHLFHYCHINEIKTSLSIGGWMGLNKTKIMIKPFTRHLVFMTAQELWDKYIKFAGKCVVAQVPSVILQGLGREKKDFLPTKEPASKGLLSLFKKKKEGEESKDHKLMFGSY